MQPQQFQLVELDAQHQPQYQQFNDLHGNILQDWQWGEFQRHLGNNVRRFFLVDTRNEDVANMPQLAAPLAAAQVITRRTGGRSYAFLPYGPVVPEQDPGQRSKLAAELCRLLATKIPDLIFVRIEPQFELGVVGSHDKARRFKKSGDINPHKTLILDTTKSEEQLLSEMHPKTRYNIKVGQRNGVAVSVSGQFDAEVAKIFQATAKRSQIRFFSGDYYRTMLQFFSAADSRIQAKLYVARHGADTLAANIMLFYKGSQVIYLFGGSSDAKRTMKGPHVLQWQAISDAVGGGYASYDFWGVEEDPHHPWAGFSKFKFGFGGKVAEYAGTHDFVLKPAWYNIYRTLRKLNRFIRT